MPNPAHFDTPHPQRLAIRSIAVGDYVRLSAGTDPATGPLDVCDYGRVLADAAPGLLVRELVSGRLWAYPEHELQAVPADAVPASLLTPQRPGDGSYVTLADDYKEHDDAARGPLTLNYAIEAYGIVLLDDGSGNMLVRSCWRPSSVWWYASAALRHVATQHVHESLRAGVRPAWGDFVTLAHGYEDVGNARDGPLLPNCMGVVVQDVGMPDAAGGLARVRYVVRDCREARLFCYQEAALSAVHPSLMKERGPPSSGRARMRLVDVQLQLRQHDGAPVPCFGVRQQGRRSMRTAWQVVPGKAYVLHATLRHKDAEGMLTSLKPSAFALFAPSGQPGKHVQLQPVVRTPKQRQRLACVPMSPCGTLAYMGMQEMSAELLLDLGDVPLVGAAGRVTELQLQAALCFGGSQRQHFKALTLCLQSAASSSKAGGAAAVLELVDLPTPGRPWAERRRHGRHSHSSSSDSSSSSSGGGDAAEADDAGSESSSSSGGDGYAANSDSDAGSTGAGGSSSSHSDGSDFDGHSGGEQTDGASSRPEAGGRSRSAPATPPPGMQASAQDSADAVSTAGARVNSDGADINCGSGAAGISSILEQLERQAAPGVGPLWAEGTDDVQALAARAVEAAEEWQRHWRRRS